jgi:hypothetical protein
MENTTWIDKSWIACSKDLYLEIGSVLQDGNEVQYKILEFGGDDRILIEKIDDKATHHTSYHSIVGHSL